MKLGIYKHYKNKLYEIIRIAKHSETLEDLVVYKISYNDPRFEKNQIWLRPKKMFLEKININGKEISRFEFIKNNNK